MHVSLSEFEATLVKAALAVGLPLGPAEQAGMAGRASLVKGFDPLRSFVLALDSLDQGISGGFDPGSAPRGIFRPSGARLSALLAGPSALDLSAVETTKGQEISLLALDAPGVLVTLALHASEQIEAAYVLRWPAGEAEVFFRDGALGLAGSGPGDLAASGSFDLVLRRVEGSDPALSPVKWASSPSDAILKEGAELDSALWGRLTELAERRLVAGTETSRLSGAGAGVVDRD